MHADKKPPAGADCASSGPPSLRPPPSAFLDVSFGALNLGGDVPCDHGYLLYAGLCALLPWLHEDGSGIGVHPIRGQAVRGQRLLRLTPDSRVCLRVGEGGLETALALANRAVMVGEAEIWLGRPTVHPLAPSPALRSRLVTVKGCMEQTPFLQAIQAQLEVLGVKGAGIGIGKRRTLRIRHKEVVGYEVRLDGLGEAESLAAQAAGLGGRRHMGCGVFTRAEVGARKGEGRRPDAH